VKCSRGPECVAGGDLPESEFRVGRSRACKPCEAAMARARRMTAVVPVDHAQLAPFANDLERGVLEALAQHGHLVGAAEALGMSTRVLRGHLRELERRAARAGWAPASDMVKPQPEGFAVKGVSTYYRHNPDGTVEARGQWVKTRRDEESRLEALIDAVQRLAEPFQGAADPVPQAGAHDSDLLCVYPLGDPHIGMYAWAAETGASFDLEIAERNLVAAVDHLVALAPPAKEALVVSLGDTFHADDSTNRTARSGHALDVDTRWSKVLGVGIRIMRRIIDRALEKHELVTVILEIGNHDDHSSVFLAHCLAQFYEREPRVRIDTSPAKFHWYRFGRCLIGTTHTDSVKPKDLGGVMAADRAEDWGETLHRYFYCGHVHHDRVLELPGVLVENFRTLAPRDAWHSGAGYRSGQDMKLDVLHREHGRINRHIVGIQQLVGRAA
jgi:hypothetical protein